MLLDETANSTTSSNEAKDASPSGHHHVQGGSSTGNSAHSATPHSSPSHLLDESDGVVDTTEPRSQLDNLLQLEDQRMQSSDPRDKSHSPDENLNVANFPKLFGGTQDFAALFGLTSLLPSGSQTSSPTTSATATATVTVKSGSELAKALGGKSNGRHNSFSQLDLGGSRMNDFMQNYVKNNWQLPEECKF
jgi:hypothetical protein